jgi:glucosylceramidase
MATIVMNQTDEKIEYNFIVDGQQSILSIPARAMQTLVY